jgi:hypothetical protein
MKLFLDLDGCLTNFDKAVEKLGPEAAKGLPDDAPESDKQVMYDAIEKAGESFWADMEWNPGGKELWEIVRRFNPVLLSSPGKFSAAPSGKAMWIKNNIPGTTLFVTQNKPEYVDPYELSVLIDDMKKNIGAWEEAGGEGILHTSTPETERKFLELLWNVPDINPEQIYW